jgi:hypothetical protein
MQMRKLKGKFIKLNNKNAGFYIIIFLFIAGYVLFFSSYRWMPVGIAANLQTKLGQIKQFNGRQITLLRWDYCKKQNTMEVELNIQNSSFDGKNKYNYLSMDKAGNNASIKTVLEEPDWVILQIKNIPHRWSEMVLRVGMKSSKAQYLKFYTNINDVNKVKKITVKTRAAYLKGRFKRTIDMYYIQIEHAYKNIEKNQKERKEILQEISRLKESEKYQTTSQKEETESSINEADSRFKEDREKINNLYKKITEIHSKIDLTKKEMNEVLK